MILKIPEVKPDSVCKQQTVLNTPLTLSNIYRKTDLKHNHRF